MRYAFQVTLAMLTAFCGLRATWAVFWIVWPVDPLLGIAAAIAFLCMTGELVAAWWPSRYPYA